MKKTEYHFWHIGQYKEEEKWLNEESAKGRQLVYCKGIKYIFEENVQPDEYQYKIIFMKDAPASVQGQDFLQFLKDYDIEIIGTWINWVYLRKKNDGTDFEIYSTVSEELEEMKRIKKFTSVLLTAEVLCVLMELFAFIGSGDIAIGIPLIFLCALTVFLYKIYKSIDGRIKIIETENSIFE